MLQDMAEPPAEHTYNVHGHYVPRGLHLDGPSDPAHVLRPLGVLTRLSHFDLEEEQEEQQKKVEMEGQKDEEKDETVRVRAQRSYQGENLRKMWKKARRWRGAGDGEHEDGGEEKMEKMQKPSQNQYPVHHVPDDA